ncbi:MAG TPA: hypothetical protein VK760_05440, partial [Candidatus Acidoferrales bacterium]|nr:hypothetical protein [Candidatus Acidoferrales bacterium]
MLLLMIPYLAAFAFVALELGGALRRRAPRTPSLPPWVWLAALLVTYAVQLGAVRYGATHLTSDTAWRLAMPIPVMYVDSTNVDAISAVFLLCAAVQSYALLALYRSRASLAIVAGGAAVLLVMSVCAPALLSFDPYGYVHNALLGLQAWSPPATPFAGEYRVIDLWFGKPTATLYGPLWLAIVRMVTGAMPTLLTKLLALRVFNAVLYVVLIVLL